MQDAFGVARRRAFMDGFRLRLGRFAHTAILTQASSVPRYARFLWGGLRVEPGHLLGGLRGLQVAPDICLRGLQVQPGRLIARAASTARTRQGARPKFWQQDWGANLLECDNLPEEPIH